MFFIKKPATEYTATIYGNYPWIIETIDELFDDVLCQLDLENSYIYGGAVRDLLANMPLIGDLDIIVENPLFKETFDIFKFSARWSLKDISNSSKYGLISPPALKKTSSENTTKIATFVNKNGIKLQIISPNNNDKELTDDIPCSRSVWDVVRYTDIRSSGILITLLGDLYEIVPGAVNDCSNRVLKINPFITKEVIKIDNLCKRIDKLTKRGWTNEINLADYKSLIEDLFIDTSTEMKNNTYDFLKETPLWQK